MELSSVSATLQKSMWWLLLATITLTPWLFGSAQPLFELYLTYAVVAVCTLWCGLLMLDERLLAATLRRAGWPALCLALLAGWVAVPLTPVASAVAATLSPATAKWTQMSLPAEREQLASAAEAIPATPAQWHSGPVSLNRAGNWQMFLRLAGLCFLFLAVASLPNPEASLRQLAWLAVFLGTALGLVSLLQSVTPGTGWKIYGVFDTPGGYGPFVNKNHYPFFANLAIGLSVGLLFERTTRGGLGWNTFFHDVTALWLLLAVVLQITSLTMALSRGGLTSLLVAMTLVTMVRLKPGRGMPLSMVLMGLFVALIVGFMSWAGFNAFETRLSMLGEADAYREDGRWYFWQVTMDVFRQFPLFGSGGETFRYWETILQSSNADWNSGRSTGQRADNELLDILSEYGIVATLAVLGFAVTLIASLWGRVRRNGLIAGAMIGVLCVTLHSLLDFGLRIPATAAFAITVAALAHASRSSVAELKRRDPEPAAEESPRWWSMSAVLLTVVVFLVFASHWLRSRQQYASADQYRLAAYTALSAHNVDRVEDNLQRMIEATPYDVDAHLEYARLALLVSRAADPADQQRLLDTAIVHCVRARDLCPLVWEAPFWIAQHADRLVTPRRLEHLSKAHWLHPSNATISYLCGLEAFNEATGGTSGESPAVESPADKSLDSAGLASMAQVIEPWQASLRYSPQYLVPIAERAMPVLGPSVFLEQLLAAPSDNPVAPATLVKAADWLTAHDYAESVPEYLKQAAAAIGSLLPEADVRDRPGLLLLGAGVQARLGNFTEAADLQRQAVRLDPQRVERRIKLVDYLIDARRLPEARRELNALGGALSGNAEAQKARLSKRIFEIEHPRLELEK